MGSSSDETTSTTHARRQATGTAGVGRSCLVVLSEPQLGRRIPIEDAELVVGRGSSAGVQIFDSSVSRGHAKLTIRNRQAFLQDLGSTNGTVLGGLALPPHEDFLLEGGDLIRMGDCVIKYLEEGAVESRYHEQLYRSMVVDELTRIYNRRFAVEFLEREMSRTRRHGRELSVVLLDIDHFKFVNDEAGHAAGDEVLRQVAACLRDQLRREACVARYGGEEFLVILPETGAEGARVVAEMLRAAVESLAPVIDGAPREITVSAGVGVWHDGLRGVEDLVREADGHLYAAKDAGRNCVAG